MPTKKVFLKVLLLQFDDIKAPTGYTKQFFEQLILGHFPPTQTPDGRPIGTSLFSYFLGASDDKVSIVGEVLDWKTATGYKVTKIPHWKSATMSGNPAISAEAFPMIAALAMKTFGYTGANFKNAKYIQTGNHKGEPVNAIAILYAGWVRGGGQRSWGGLRTAYNEFKDKNFYKNHNDNDVKKLTQIGWDDDWNTLPDELIVLPAIYDPNFNFANNSNDAGMALVIPGQNDLTLHPLSILLHEIGHLRPVADLPDLYGGTHDSWSQIDLYGHPADCHFPTTIASYNRSLVGWFNFATLSQRLHKELVLPPFITHNVAFQFPCGMDPENNSYSESIIIENRDYLDYQGLNGPPTSSGPRLVFYRLDPVGRRKIMWDNSKQCLGRITTMIRGYFEKDFYWPQYNNNNMPADMKYSLTEKLIPPNSSIAKLGNHNFALSSRNSLQELWWEFENIAQCGLKEVGDGIYRGMRFDAIFRPIDLRFNYHRATWMNNEGEILTPDEWMGSRGTVMMQNISRPISDGKKFRYSIFLHPSWKPNGWIRGRYSFASLGGKNLRLYARVALSEEAVGSDGIEFEFVHSNKKVRVNCKTPGEIKVVSMDIINFEGTFDLYVKASTESAKDWGYLLEGLLVPLPEIYYDFVSNGKTATWRNADGEIIKLEEEEHFQSVDHVNWVQLHDGVTYGPQLLKTWPKENHKGKILGTFGPITIPQKAVFSAQIGLTTFRSYGQAVQLRVSFQDQQGNVYNLIKDCGIAMYDPQAPEEYKEYRPVYNPSPGYALKINRTTIFEVYLKDLENMTGYFIFDIRQWGGSSSGDFCYWPSARIYRLK